LISSPAWSVEPEKTLAARRAFASLYASQFKLNAALIMGFSLSLRKGFFSAK